MSDERRSDLPEQPPQVPADERHPSAPKIGVDEWVARVERDRERPGGLVGVTSAALQRVPVQARILAIVAAAALFPFATDSGYLMRVGINTLLFALLALGLNVVVGWAGLLDLGYVAFYGFGAYAYAFVSSGQFDIHLPTAAAIPVVIVASAILGLLLGLSSWRLLGDYLAIVTLFFAQIFITFTTNGNRINLPWEDQPFNLTGGPNGIPGVDRWGLLGFRALTLETYYWIALAFFGAILLMLYLLNDSRTGRAWRAVREDPLAAAAMTMPVNLLKLMAFALGAATAGLTGSIFAAVQTGVFPQNFELPLLITIYAMVILGGAGSLAGVVIGAVGIASLLEVLRNPAEARVVFYALILAGLVSVFRGWTRAGAPRLAAVVGGAIAFGVLVHDVAEAAFPRWVERTPVRGESLFADAIDAWVLLPTDPGTPGNVGFVLLVFAVLGLTLLRGWWRTAALVPTVYLAAFVWENRLIFVPSITRLLLLGAILVAVMNFRPQGLLGTARVEIL